MAGEMVKFTKTTTRRAKRSYRRRGKAKVSKTIKAYVDRKFTAGCEAKYLITRYVNSSINTTIGITPTAISLLPSETGGSTRFNRVGNEITLKDGFIRGRVNLLPYNATTNTLACPIAVKMWLLSSVQYNEIGAFSGTSAATAFFKSDTTPAGLSGSVLDLLQSVETENFRVYAEKTIILGTASNSINFPSTLVEAYTAEPFSAPFYFNWKKHIKKLKYNGTSSSSIPTNRNLWLVFQAVSLSGTAPSLQVPCEFHACIENHYIDA